jgi:phosphoglycerate dehydrogenase-like enzyme
MKLVIHPPVDDTRLVAVAEAARPMLVVNAATEGSALHEIVDADAFFGKLTPAMLAKARKLSWVQAPTASLEHYLFPELIQHPSTLTNMRGIYSDVIADHVFAFILCFARNLHRYLRQQLHARWAPVGGEAERSTFAAGPGTVSAIDRAHLHLGDCTLGIVGLGHIGREVARRGQAFGVHVLAVDPVANEPPAGVALWRMEKLNDLLESSDFVVIAAPHTPETVKLIRRPQLARMKATAYLINVGRGVIVDMEDLVSALRDGLIAGAALDVFEEEPLPPEHPLWRLENVILTPHVAAASVRIASRHLAVFVENARRFVAGRPLQNVVDKRCWF